MKHVNEIDQMVNTRLLVHICLFFCLFKFYKGDISLWLNDRTVNGKQTGDFDEAVKWSI